MIFHFYIKEFHENDERIFWRTACGELHEYNEYGHIERDGYSHICNNEHINCEKCKESEIFEHDLLTFNIGFDCNEEMWRKEILLLRGFK